MVWTWDEGREQAIRGQVTLGSARQDGWIEVLSGLRPGDVLIDSPPSDLEDGSRVRIVAESSDGTGR